MEALIMCGGAGTRLDADVEKPLYEVAGRPMIDSVLDALSESRVDAITAAVSPQTPATAAHLDRRCRVLETPGEGYVTDLGVALETVEPPVLTVAADLPLLDAAVVDRVLDRWPGDGSLTVVVPRALKRRLGVSVATAADAVPAGCNVVGASEAERTHCSYDARLAVNVNTTADATVAAEFAAIDCQPRPGEVDE